ncbi:MAG TPA: rRNA pseudouridine synthase [Candidatus Eisenbergiella merdipullorum]|uniref:Pseudouridine synthase n=1 Tax=Candidatus Eisenbergiella merdipullorum TaxID=2838553 RepID=A0A9D2I8H2_9FIRM|nr:rRNA pseudouridine synthase [Candidatus Eisenbergiella merdipullorum]
MEQNRTEHTKQERLNKFLADCGICSRREADRMIEAGRVTVNGRPAGTGVRVSPSDEVLVDGRPLKRKDKKVVLAFYKPVGVTCTEKDRYAEKTIRDVVDYPVRVTYAGRLDRDSEGLLLLTNDGDLINALMRASNFHEKEYLVRVNRPLTDDFLQKMAEGVFLKDLDIQTRPCRVEREGKYVFRIVLTQGLNRQIRRMCRALGINVVSIKRVRVANITLGRMKPGNYRLVEKEEREELYRIAFGGTRRQPDHG